MRPRGLIKAPCLGVPGTNLPDSFRKGGREGASGSGWDHGKTEPPVQSQAQAKQSMCPCAPCSEPQDRTQPAHPALSPKREHGPQQLLTALAGKALIITALNPLYKDMTPSFRISSFSTSLKPLGYFPGGAVGRSRPWRL